MPSTRSTTPTPRRCSSPPLSCSLAGQTMTVHIKEGTQAASAYQRSTVSERYYCNFGLNPAYLNTIEQAGLTVSGTDRAGEPRILEPPAHHFFVATLFVPQTSSTPTCPHPLLERIRLNHAVGRPSDGVACRCAHRPVVPLWGSASSTLEFHHLDGDPAPGVITDWITLGVPITQPAPDALARRLAACSCSRDLFVGPCITIGTASAT